MSHVDIFKKAWELATLRKYKKLLWYGFIPAFFTTILSTISYSLRGYQYWLELFAGGDIRFTLLALVQGTWAFLSANPALLIVLLVIAVLFTVSYMLMPVFCHGGLVRLILDILQEKDVKYRIGFVYGSKYFFPLFEYKALFQPFRTTWPVLTYWAIHTFSPELVPIMAAPLVVWMIISLLASVLFVFSEYFIVLEDMPMLPAIGKSIRTVFLNLEQVLYIILLLLLIGLRVIFNIILVFGIPALIIVVAGFFASSVLATIAMILAVLLGIVLLGVLAYVNAIVTVFTTAAWELIFFEYTKSKELESE